MLAELHTPPKKPLSTSGKVDWQRLHLMCAPLPMPPAPRARGPHGTFPIADDAAEACPTRARTARPATARSRCRIRLPHAREDRTRRKTRLWLRARSLPHACEDVGDTVVARHVRGERVSPTQRTSVSKPLGIPRDCVARTCRLQPRSPRLQPYTSGALKTTPARRRRRRRASIQHCEAM